MISLSEANLFFLTITNLTKETAHLKMTLLFHFSSFLAKMFYINPFSVYPKHLENLLWTMVDCEPLLSEQ